MTTRAIRRLPASGILLLAVFAATAPARATHYPAGAFCYDCHAVTASKMVIGTHLIKASQKTADLGITSTSTAMRCLFCHERNAVSVPVTPTRVMRPVLDHFDSTPASKHRASLQSTVLGQDPALFDCRDCHAALGGSVTTDPVTGDTKIHGKDPGKGEQLNVYAETLVGAPAIGVVGQYRTPDSLSTDEEKLLSQATCSAAACHGGAGANSFGDRSAPTAHGYAKGVTLNDGGAPANDVPGKSGCTQCHGTHRSPDGVSLLVLKNTSGANGQPPTNATVRPDECEVCHSQDDAAGAVSNVYAAKGHGMSTIGGGSIRCVNCHSAAVPHGFSSSAPGGNSLRFAFTEDNSATSSIRQQPPYNSALSICMICHAPYAGKLHQGATATAGCNDCHEPHGGGVGTNSKMIRAVIPKVDAAGNPVYGQNSATGAWEANVYTGPADDYRADAQGLCDNAECHQGRSKIGSASVQLYPLATFMAGTQHSGGGQAAGSNCESCHSHTDPAGSWRASSSCTTCHGQPPVDGPTTSASYAPPAGLSESTLPHRKHAVTYSFPCQACHSKYADAATHNTGGWDGTGAWANQANASYQSVYFDAALNPSANNALAGTAPKDHAASYDTATYTCSNLYCHSDGQSSASQGAVSWTAGPLGCNKCHGLTTTANARTYGAPDHPNGTGGNSPNSHAKHGNYACSVCHFDTIADANAADGWTLSAPGFHVNGKKDLRADQATATFADTRVTSGGATTCGTISCHNGGSAKWGATLGCTDCHARTTAQGGDLDNWNLADGVASAVNSDEWTYSGHGRTGTAYDASGNPAAAFGGPAGDASGCGYCHDASVAHGTATNPFRLRNVGVVSGTANESQGWNDACLICHKTGQAAWGPGGYAAKTSTSRTDGDHYGTKHGAPTQGGAYCWDCHDPHGDRTATGGNVFMVQRAAAKASNGTTGVPATTVALTFTAAATGTDYAKSTAPYDGVCNVCHAATGHYTGAAGDGHNAATRCTTCHSHGQGFGAGCTSCHGNTAAGNWWPDSTAEHGTAYPNRVGDHSQHVDAIAIARFGANPTVAQKNTTCDTCHPNPGSTGHDANTTGSLANAADVHRDPQNATTHFKAIGGAANGVLTESYNNAVAANGKSCANVDCHYRAATPTTGTVTANGDGWYQPTAAATCSSCHGFGVVGAALPNSHPVHVATTAGKGLGCGTCHPSGAYTTSHQSGAVEWSFANTLDPATGGPRTETYNGLATGTTTVKYGAGTFGTCAATYCHGNFTGGTAANAPTWGTAATGQCGTCHPGNGTGNLTVMNDANHTDHLTAGYGPNFTNAGCTGTATTGCHTGSAVTDATHVNGAVEFANVVTTTSAAAVLGATAPAGAPDATSTDRCNRCHSTATVGGGVGTVLAKANWSNGTYKVPCLNCHNAAAPATQFANGTGAAAPAKDAYWTSGGHGRTTAFPVTGNPAPNYACTVCHDETLGHVSGALGDANRLKAVTESPALAYTDANSEVCLDCHKVGQATAPAAGAGRLGYDATNEATVHSGGVTGKYTTSALATNAFPAYGDSANYAANPGYQCRACHDAHGTTKLAMVLATIDGKVKGVSNPKAVGAAFDAATATSLAGLDPTSAADDGVCDVCHSAAGTTAPHPDTAHPGNHNQGGAGQSCLGCHDHKKSFQGGCTSCHGNTAAGTWWPDSTAEHGTGYPNRLGDHQQHIDAIAVARFGATPTVAQKNTTCDTCHPNPGSTGHDANTAGSLVNAADVHRDPQNASTHFKTISGATNGVLTESYDNAVAANGKSCANVDCHYRTTTPTTGTATANGDGWYQPTAAATCSSCHGFGVAGAALPNSHPRHVGTAAGQKAYPCSYCHPSGGYTTSHQTGAVDWSFATTLDPGATRTETYNGLATGATTVKYGTGTFATCANVYCHIQTASPAWNATIPAVNGCTNCHTVNGAAAYEPKSGLHNMTVAGVQKHDNTLAANGCSECHVTETTTHVDGTFVADSGTNTDRWVTRPGLTWTDATTDGGTCSGTGLAAASGCHQDDGNWSRLWSTAANSAVTTAGDARCNVCHGQFGNWRAGTSHYGTNGGGVSTRGSTHNSLTGAANACEDCHSYPSLSVNHRNGKVTMNDGGATGHLPDPNAVGTVSYCSACHTDDGMPSAAGTHTWPVTALTSARIEEVSGANAPACQATCHGGGSSYWPSDTSGSAVWPNRAGAHAKHTAAISAARGVGANSTCVACHPGTHVGDQAAAPADVAQDGQSTRTGYATQYFQTMLAASDTNASYSSATMICSNVDCHGNNPTPKWYADTVAPAFSPNSTLTVTNPASDGDLQVSWNAATDAGTAPVKYDVYQQAGAVADACATGAIIASDLGATSYLATGLTNGSTYSFCVKAKDSVTPTPNTAKTTTASASPTVGGGGCGTGTAQTLYVDMPATGSYGIDGAQAPSTFGADTAYVANGGRQELQIGSTGLTANNYRFITWPGTGTFYRSGRFYLAQGGICVGPNISAGNFANRTTSTSDQYQFRLVDYNPTGASYNGTTIATSANLAGTTTATGTAFNLTFPQYSIPAGHWLALEVWNSVAATSDSIRIYGGSTTNTAGTYFTTSIYTQTADTTAPVFTGVTSAVDATTGGTAILSWSAAADAYPSNPVRYTVYVLQSATVPTAATLFQAGNIVQQNILGTSTTVSGLTNGLPYFFGVRATDSANNSDANTAIRPAVAPGVTTTGGSGGGGGCTTCHTWPQASGAHNKHGATTNPTVNAAPCAPCHGDVSAYTTGHSNGVLDLPGVVYSGEPTPGVVNGTCSSVSCHLNTTTPVWNTAPGTLRCDGCHGYPPTTTPAGATNHGATTPANVGTTRLMAAHGDCSVCHGFSAAVAGDPASGAGIPVDKTAVGGDKYDRATMHGDGKVQMNGVSTPDNGQNTGYAEATNNCLNATACHATTWKFNGTIRANTVETKELGKAECSTCHDTGIMGAPVVTASSSHVDADGAGATYAAGQCDACHAGHADGTSGVNDVEISTQRGASQAGTTPTHTAGTVPTMNYAYASHGSKIRLGGAATSGYAKSTEAEICWSCHDANGVSEWGVNQNSQTGNLTYNYGALSTSNWTTATWTSGKGTDFSYKTGPVTSTHSANFDLGTSAITATANASGYYYGSAAPDNTVKKETVDAVANIRCSYCHDVHGTHNAVEPASIQNNNPPYLRGTWKGAAYPEDGAPRGGWANWTANGTYGAVPRASASSANTGKTGVANLGGYWIDQNSANPNSGITTSDTTAGLCAICHGGSATGTWPAGTLDAIDWKTGEALWVSTGDNGHKNVVLGGSGSTNVLNNIFTRTRRGSSARAAIPTGSDQYNEDMGLGTSSSGASEGGYSYRGQDGLNLAPSLNRPYGWRYFAWGDNYNTTAPSAGSAIAAGTPNLEVGGMAAGATAAQTEAASYAAQSKYHSFNCGKCHNPHASRLPKLMITNCLDTNHNTWDDTQGKATGAPAAWLNARDSQWPTAQNCHRLDDRGALSTGSSTVRGTGWNKVTPWAETTTPDP